MLLSRQLIRKQYFFKVNFNEKHVYRYATFIYKQLRNYIQYIYTLFILLDDFVHALLKSVCSCQFKKIEKKNLFEFLDKKRSV